jgi:hypothetical protein
MKFSDFVFQSKMIVKHEAERYKRDLEIAAFIGWQDLVTQGEKVTFAKYLSDLGLNDKDNDLTPEEKAKIVKKAYATGERIMNSFKGTI